MNKKRNKILSKSFLTTLFVKQNKWHRYSVLRHTLAVTWSCIKEGDYRFIVAALLHDIGKPFVSAQDEKDIKRGTYSFIDHEECSYQIIKNVPFLSDRTKDLIRWHYLIRDIYLSNIKGRVERHDEKKAIWDSLPEDLQKELAIFLRHDDNGK